MLRVQRHKRVWQAMISGAFPCVIGTISSSSRKFIQDPTFRAKKKHEFDVGDGVRLFIQDGTIELVTENQRSIERMLRLLMRFSMLDQIKNNLSTIRLHFSTLYDFSFETTVENTYFELSHYYKPKGLNEEFTPNYISWETHKEKKYPTIVRLGKVTDIRKGNEIVPIHRIVSEHCVIPSANDSLLMIINESKDLYRKDEREIQSFIWN